jgi:hypothetical protein
LAVFTLKEYTVLLAQEFKTLGGAQKRAAFENAHCGKRYFYTPVRCLDGQPDPARLNPDIFHKYTWRLERKTR